MKKEKIVEIVRDDSYFRKREGGLMVQLYLESIHLVKVL